MKHFGDIYAPISAGQMSCGPPSILNNFANNDNWVSLEMTFKKAEVMFNHYCYTMIHAAIQPEYWIQRAIQTIHWNGVALMDRGEGGIEFIKLHGQYTGEGNGVLSDNGYTLINLAEFGFINDT